MTPDTTHPAWCGPADCATDAGGFGFHRSAAAVVVDAIDGLDTVVSVQLVNWAEAMAPDCDGYVYLTAETGPDRQVLSMHLSAAEDLVDLLTAAIAAARPSTRLRRQPLEL